MKTSELLRAAWAKIDAPEKWTKGAFAKTKFGEAVCFRNKNAVCFCSEGALLAVDCDGDDEDMWDFLRLAMGESIPIFNDRPSTTHDDIRRVWMRAIELAESEETNA